MAKRLFFAYTKLIHTNRTTRPYGRSRFFQAKVVWMQWTITNVWLPFMRRRLCLCPSRKTCRNETSNLLLIYRKTPRSIATAGGYSGPRVIQLLSTYPGTRQAISGSLPIHSDEACSMKLDARLKQPACLGLNPFHLTKEMGDVSDPAASPTPPVPRPPLGSRIEYLLSRATTRASRTLNGSRIGSES